MGQYADSLDYLLQALDLYRDRGNTYQEAGTLDRLARRTKRLVTTTKRARPGGRHSSCTRPNTA
jgi:hypothetical protein